MNRKKRLSALASVLLALIFVASFALAEDAAEPAPDFTLSDQYGVSHTLSDYQGQVVFLNFWTTWCPWCVREMPDIEALYHELGENGGEVAILGIASPGVYDSVDEAGIADFLTENGITYPVLMDRDGSLFNTYGATSLPTTWLIGPDGVLYGYVQGAMEKTRMLEVIDMAKNP